MLRRLLACLYATPVPLDENDERSVCSAGIASDFVHAVRAILARQFGAHNIFLVRG